MNSTSKYLKSILITGATSGIGKYAVKVFTERGWIVWAGYRKDEGKANLLKINTKLVRPIHIDVIDAQSIAKAHAIIAKSGIPLHVLCNNAGIAFGAPIELLDISETQRAFDVNFFGPLRMIQAFLPLLRKTSGRVINIGSVSGLVGIPFEVPTSSSKFALEGMSDSLRREIRYQNITVSIIEPVLIQTEIWPKSIRLSLDLLKDKQTQLQRYKQATDKLLHLLDDNPKLFMSLSCLKKPLLHAAESRYPKRRYLAYRHSAMLTFIIRVLPDGLVDWLFGKLLSSAKHSL